MPRGLKILLKPLLSNIDASNKKIDKTGTTELSPGDLNQIAVKKAIIILTINAFKKIFFKNRVAQKAIKIEIKKYIDQIIIMKNLQ